MFLFRIIKEDFLTHSVSAKDDLKTFILFIIISLLFGFYIGFSIWMIILLFLSIIIFIISNFMEFFNYFKIGSGDIHYYLLYFYNIIMFQEFQLSYVLITSGLFLIYILYFYLIKKTNHIPLLPILLPNIIIAYIIFLLF